MSAEQITQARIDAAIANRVNDKATKVVNFIGECIEFSGDMMRKLGIVGFVGMTVYRVYDFATYSKHRNLRATSHVVHWDEDMTIYSELHYDKKETDIIIDQLVDRVRMNLAVVINGIAIYCVGGLMRQLGRYLRQRKVSIW
jgi:hypoxanthine-guanine phosphoribosyltransferase